MNTLIKIHTEFEQGSEDWHNIRAGRIGGTSAKELLSNGRSENGLSVKAIEIVYKKAAELVEGPKESYLSDAMQRGIELEPLARERYEEEFFETVQQVGYISLGNYLGVSPDGLIGEDGGIEIKCPEGKEFLRYLDTKAITKPYYTQVQWNLFITGRKWWDFVYYHPHFEPSDLIVTRIKPDQAYFEKWNSKIDVYVKELERVLNKVAQVKQD